PSTRSLSPMRYSTPTVTSPNRHHGSSSTRSGRSLTGRSYILHGVDARGLADAMQGRYEEYVDALHELVDVDSGTYTRDGVNRVVDMCEARFRAAGWSVERRAHTPAEDDGSALGDLLIGRLDGA